VNPTILDGRYRLVKTAGTGGTANVYLAESTTTGEKVAVKVLKKALVQQDDMPGRFQRQAKLLQAVPHPNIVKLIEFVDAPEGWLLLMQWAEGERLDRLTLNPEETKTVLAQLASALAAVHAAGIVHRDLKPENIVVSRTPVFHAWLLDLGIARFTDSTQAAADFMTRQGQGAGTPAFISPEQIQGQDPDPRSDVYSFGAMAYRLLSGRPPFEGPNDFTVLNKHLSEKPAPLKVTDPSLAGVEALVLQCLEKKPSARPADGAALYAALTAPVGPAKKRWWPFG